MVVRSHCWQGTVNGMFWRREVAVDQGFVEDVESSAAARFFQVCGHAPDWIDFEVRVAAAS